MTTITLDFKERSYAVNVGKGLLCNVGNIFNLNRKVFVLTDSGVPGEYSKAVADAAKESMIYTVKSGEGSKSLPVMEEVLSAMLSFGMTRSDALVAVGGGVVGDLGGFCASVYMRGIDFYNVPTTVLSQIDSSIGGKTAVNLMNTKNSIGTFYQPRGVLVDINVLKTLPDRQISAGLAEALKMSMTSDANLFEFIEKEELDEKGLEKIIVSSLMIKKNVVEQDEKESGLRKILNFGHTFGHGIEAESGMNKYFHGECVALGMLPVTSEDARKRLIPVLKKLALPTKYTGNVDKALEFVCHDKKLSGNTLDVVTVEKIGSYKIKKMTLGEFEELVKKNFT